MGTCSWFGRSGWVGVLMCVGASAFGYERTFNDWVAGMADRDTHAALTESDSGAGFGQVCVPSLDQCIWVVAFDSSCKAGDRYHALINSDHGAESVELICDRRLDSGLYRYFLDDFDAIDNLVRNSRRFGIAIPLEGDEFMVLRFSMRGAKAAVDFMRGEAGDLAKRRGGSRPPQRNRGDQRL